MAKLMTKQMSKPGSSFPLALVGLALALAGLAWLALPVARAGAVDPVRLTPSFKLFAGTIVGETSAPVKFTLRNAELPEVTVEEVAIVDKESGRPPRERESFGIVADNCLGSKLEESETCVIEITFKGPTYEIAEAKLSVKTSGGSAAAELAGQAKGVELTMTPAEVEFGTVAVGATSAAERVRVRAEGNIALKGIEPPEILGPERGRFEVVKGENECGTELSATNRCFVYMVFKPTAGGKAEAELQVISAVNTERVKLVGHGERPTADLAPSNFDFGKVEIGKEGEAAKFKLTNTATVAPLAFEEEPEIAGVQAGEFQLIESAEDPCPHAFETLAPKASCEITVVFAPEAAEPAEAELVVNTDAEGGPLRRMLKGDGIGAKLAVHPGDHDFGAQAVGTSSNSFQYTIEDVGTSSLRVESIKLGGADAGEFSVDRHGCEGAKALLQAGGQCTVLVAFAPTGSAGAKEAKLEVKSDGGEESPTLTGTATQVEATLEPGEHDFGEVEVGQTGSFEFTVANPGPGEVSVEAISLSGAGAGEFELEEGSCAAPKTLMAKGSCSITVRFHPTGTGAKEARLKVVAGGKLLEATLKGVGS